MSPSARFEPVNDPELPLPPCAAMHAHREAVTNKEGMAAAAERLNLPPFLQLHAGQTQGLSAGMKVGSGSMSGFGVVHAPPDAATPDW